MKTLIVLVGPTGVGKTDLSIGLARRCLAPIISADSRQLYHAIPIGTAAPTEAELRAVRHYMVGTLELTDYYNAAQYATDALALLDELFLSHDTVVLTGGSMLYIDALCYGLDDLPQIAPTLRRELHERFATEGLEPLADELQQLDPTYYATADVRNPKRVIHALEVCLQTRRPYSELRTAPRAERPFRIIRLGLDRPRPELYARIDRRVEQMITLGLEQEARNVYPLRHLNSLNTVGYKELFDYFDGNTTRHEAIEKIKQHSRNYAKRQLTWFRRDKSTTWFHPDQTDELYAFVEELLPNRKAEAKSK